MAYDDQRGSVPPAFGSRRRRPAAAAFRIQEVLATATTPLGLSEISRRSALPKSTAARVLADLTEAGIAERMGSRFAAGDRLLSLVDRVAADGSGSLRRMILPYLVQLHDRTGLAVAFAILRYGRVHYTNFMYGPAEADLLASVPMCGPAHHTASGKVLLAFAGSDAGAALTAESAVGIPIDRAALLQEMLRVRRDGVAYHNGEYVDGINSMAVGLFAQGPVAVGAVALCGQAGTFDLAAARAALRQIGRSANTALRAWPGDVIPG